MLPTVVEIHLAIIKSALDVAHATYSPDSDRYHDHESHQAAINTALKHLNAVSAFSTTMEQV